MTLGTLWNRSGSFEFDNNGEIATGAYANFFVGGTSTPWTVYREAGEDNAFPTDVPIGGTGRWPAVYVPYGTYKFVVYTEGGTQLFEADEVANPEPISPDVVIDETKQIQTGLIVFDVKDGTRDGFVRLNGRTIGSEISSATERAHADTQDLFEYLWSSLSDTAAPVSGGRTATAAADFAANKTITLPDWRGCSIAGLDTMGNTAASRLGSAPVVLGSTSAAGSILGANTHVLTEAQLPAITPEGTVSQITPAGTISQITPAGTISQITPAGTNSTPTVNITNGANVLRLGGANTANLTHGGGVDEAVTITASLSGAPIFTGTPVTPTFTGTPVTPTLTGTPVTPTFTGTSFGSDTAHNNLARSGLVTFYIKL